MKTVSREEWQRAIADGIASVDEAAVISAAQCLFSADLVLTAGNGGSSAIASHLAQAVMKPDYTPGGGRAAVCLTDAVPTLTAHANDGGWPGALTEAARPFLDANPRCAVALVSSSGRSANVVQLARAARLRGLPVIALTGFVGGDLLPLADVALHVDSDDYEVVEPAHDAIIHRVQYHLRRLGAGARSA